MEGTAEGTVVETVDVTQKEGTAKGTVVEIVDMIPKEMPSSKSRAKHKCHLLTAIQKLFIVLGI
jgi:hypothetical protein